MYSCANYSRGCRGRTNTANGKCSDCIVRQFHLLPSTLLHQFLLALGVLSITLTTNKPLPLPHALTHPDDGLPHASPPTLPAKSLRAAVLLPPRRLYWFGLACANTRDAIPDLIDTFRLV
jgi:hypothetical protein